MMNEPNMYEPAFVQKVQRKICTTRYFFLRSIQFTAPSIKTDKIKAMI